MSVFTRVFACVFVHDDLGLTNKRGWEWGGVGWEWGVAKADSRVSGGGG